MFQYAYAKQLALKYNEELVLNLADMGRNEAEHRELSLYHLNVPVMKKYPMPLQRIVNFCQQVYRKLWIRALKRKKLNNEQIWETMAKKGVYYCPDVYGYYKFVPTKRKYKFVEGIFLAAKYVDEFEKVKEEFRVITPPSEENKQMLERIQNCESVCVHIRKGDYSAFKSLCVCTKEYYRTGMKIISEKVTAPTFFIFSNTEKDIQWIKENYDFLNEYDTVFVNLSNPDYEEIRLMYSCKHFVISNSTFSWWAQYLSENENKLVVAPDQWHKNYSNCYNIYMDNWIIAQTESGKDE